MTLLKLILFVGVVALILSALNVFVLKTNRNTGITILQNFCGVLFVFSGLVKAIDPLGTAYKLVDYFNEFESIFSETWFGFISGIFPFLVNYSVGVSVAFIVLEIVLGVMLILGYKRGITAWLFLAIVIFFSFLTGFTYLTGYVPSDVNFFSFSEWGPYVKSNMKVKDCGCFGDFIKLEPKVSFFKDIFLLIPAIIFLVYSGKMFKLFNKIQRFTITAIIAVLTLFFCLSNYVWDLPVVDFRPFKEGVDIVKQKDLESKAQADAPITYILIEKETGKKIRVPDDLLMSNYKDYPKSKYEYLDPEYGEPLIPITKISELSITNVDGDEITDEILNHSGPSLMIVHYKLEGEESVNKVIQKDTLFHIDTLQNGGEYPMTVKRIGKITKKPVNKYTYSWNKNYQLPFINTIVPFGNAAMKDGIKVYSITKLYSKEKIEDFRKSIQADFPIYLADDILLKTIIRSNPGVVYLEDSKIIKKWHAKKLPKYSKFKEMYLSK